VTGCVHYLRAAVTIRTGVAYAPMRAKTRVYEVRRRSVDVVEAITASSQDSRNEVVEVGAATRFPRPAAAVLRTLC
jgi:hypothetical protein